MTVLKCKMCGGALELKPGETVAECPYCGTRQTVPNLDDDRKGQMFDRANRLRAACSFDRALAAYENIIGSFPEEAEAYWGELLCKYGIEYVDDPATGKKIPTCHRSSYESVLDDEAYEMTMEYASPSAKQVYRDEAKVIEEIRKGIIAVSAKEDPYDIFICYKETDDNGDRSIDSVIAQDVYDALTEKGYRVFFSRISLEDKIGKEYEPYIFAALNSAKVMLVFGTEHDHFNAVWVKNEWSRFLDLMSRDRSKTLIPCFKYIDAYDLPREFAKFQAQDMGKVGAIQDLVRGIGKILRPATVQAPAGVITSSSADPNEILKRGYLSLEDHNWNSAMNQFNRVLDVNAQNVPAYIGLALCEKQCGSLRDLESSFCIKKVEPKNIEYQPIIDKINSVTEKYCVDHFYDKNAISNELNVNTTYSSYLDGWKNQLSQVNAFFANDANLKKAYKFGSDIDLSGLEETKNNVIRYLKEHISASESEDHLSIQKLEDDFAKALGSKESTIEVNSSAARKKRDADIARKKRARIRRIVMAAVLVTGIIIYVLLQFLVFTPKSHYNAAHAYFEEKNWDSAKAEMAQAGRYTDEEFMKECDYFKAIELYVNGNSNEALELFKSLGDYKDTDYFTFMIDNFPRNQTDAERIKALTDYISENPNSDRVDEIKDLINEIREKRGEDLLTRLHKSLATQVSESDLVCIDVVPATDELMIGTWSYYENNVVRQYVFHEDHTFNYGTWNCDNGVLNLTWNSTGSTKLYEVRYVGEEYYLFNYMTWEKVK